MIAGLVGSVAGLEPDAVVLDVNGVLYRVFVPTGLLQSDSVATGERLKLETHLVVREDALTLYGFLTSTDVTWFRLLIGLNGVGPRVALAMMSKFGADELAAIVHREDVAALSSVPGIGRKTASRILLDLRGKIPEAAGEVTADHSPSQDEELIEALQGLGYSRTEAADAASAAEISPEDALEDRLLAALRALSPAG